MGTLFAKCTPRFAVYSVCFILSRSWITFNEPWCSTVLGYANGEMAPGKKVTNCGVDGRKSTCSHMFLSYPLSRVRNFFWIRCQQDVTSPLSWSVAAASGYQWPSVATSGRWPLGKTGEARHGALPGCAPHHPLACSSSDLIKQMQRLRRQKNKVRFRNFIGLRN